MASTESTNQLDEVVLCTFLNKGGDLLGKYVKTTNP